MPLLSSIGYHHQEGGPLLRTPDDYATVAQQQAALTVSYAMDPLDSTILYRVKSTTPTQVERSIDSGATWANFGVAMPGNWTGASTNTTRSVFRTRGGTLLVVRETGVGLGVRVMRSTDNGATWSTVTVHALTDDAGWGLHEHITTGNLFISSRRGMGPNLFRLDRSTDNGVTWAQVFDGGTTVLMGGAWNPSSGVALLLMNTGEATGLHRITRSTDGGATWAEVTTFAGEAAVGLLRGRGAMPPFAEVGAGHSANVGRIIFNGRFASEDNGATWAALATPAYAAGSGAIGAAQTRGAVGFTATDVAVMRRSIDGGGSWANGPGTVIGVIQESDTGSTPEGGPSPSKRLRMGFMMAAGRRIKKGT